MRCTFSESMNRQTLGVDAGSLPVRETSSSAAARTWLAVSHVLRSPRLLLHSLADDLVTTVFPADCRLCAGPLTELSGLPICAACLSSLTPCEHPGCLRCGDPLDLAADQEDLSFRGMQCLACRLAPPDFERAVSFGRYDDVFRELIHLLKYERVRPAARTLAPYLAEAVGKLHREAASSLLVVAVPLFPRAEKIRGFNQARLLADRTLRLLSRSHPAWRLQPAHHLLVRQKSTAAQFTLSRRNRRRNLAGAFAVAPDAEQHLAGREVLLLDDIFTTGATARECSRVLRRAGAARVWVATVARASGADSPRSHAADLSHAVARWGSDTH